MTNYIEFFIPGKPATSGSKTVFPRRNGKGFIVTPANKEQKNWQASIRESALRAIQGLVILSGVDSFGQSNPFVPLICALKLKCVFIIARPKGHYGTGKNDGKLKSSAPPCPITKPDSLKLARAVEDALKGIIYRDDSQICEHEIRKIYANALNPIIGVHIYISRLELSRKSQ